jgi:hypothetical protein
MRWLHLSDLHIGFDNAAQRNATASLVKSVSQQVGEGQIDLILLTGDLAYSGAEKEYLGVERQILAPLRTLSQFQHSKIAAVPGNHDLDCTIGLPISWAILGSKRQQEFFSRSDTGRQIRESRAKGFAAFQSFADRNKIITCDSLNEVAHLHSLTSSSGRKLDLACLNTAFFSDKDVRDQLEAPSPVEALRELLDAHKPSNPVFVIGHHPPSWFSRESENHFRSLLLEANAVYLHGHMHELQAHFGPKGLISLGFGAGYLAPLGAQSKPFYRNTYAICELDDDLTIELLSWDADYGSWVPENRLQAEIRSTAIASTNRYRLNLPTSQARAPSTRAEMSAFSEAKARARMNAPFWIDGDPKDGWIQLLQQLGHIRDVVKVSTIGAQDIYGGSAQFVAVDAAGSHLVRAYSAPSSTITYSQIEQTNTLLDTESIDSCVLVTFGALSEDAAGLSNRLKEKKPLAVLTGSDLAIAAANFPVVEKLRQTGAFALEAVEITPLVTKSGIGLLVVDAVSSSWICVVQADGSIADASAELTYQVRNSFPDLRELRYWKDPKAPSPIGPGSPFDREAYLRRSESLFDTVRYAGLAALGFRMPVDSLRNLYIPAAADVSANAANQQALKTAVEDFIEALKLDSAQRDQLEVQLRSFYGLNRSAESGAASGFYQKHGVILVVGDPGSGKSCFVRNEILTYCKPSSSGGEWYGRHVPVFLPLADAARMASEGEELIDVCVQFCTTQQLNISKRQLESIIARGEAAFFFDGVDEVGSLEVRQSLLRQIRQLMEKAQKLGNRFVVTSRPAALHSTEIPDELVRLRLRGLTDDEIAALATRILSIDPATGQLMSKIGKDQKLIVDQIIRDCSEKPGIRRLARNPLLLTLLVLVYSNSGSLAARRHVIYSQAIKTLVSVRHREQKAKVLSESDLRNRLGSLALSVYRGEVSEIPSREEVRASLHRPQSPAKPSMTTPDVDAFLQDVAESTGLLVIHPRSTSKAQDVISFMHHSFLEYYAAVGFMQEPAYEESARHVALLPRWREVVTLMFGLLGDKGDISAFLETLSTEIDESERITDSRLRMAIDCSLESDVPPESAQRLVAQLLARSLSEGAASAVAEARTSLAPKVQELLQNTGSVSIRGSLIAGTKSSIARVAAANVDFIGRMSAIVDEDKSLQEAILGGLKSTEESVRVAAIDALLASPKLRGSETLEILARSLSRGGFSEQLATLQLLNSEPSLVSSLSNQVLAALDSKNRLISNLAARSLIVSGTFARQELEKRALLDRALKILTQSDGPQKGLNKYLDMPRATLDSLIYSRLADEQKLGIRSLIAVQLESNVVHSYLFTVLKDSANHEVKSACLEAMSVDNRMTRSASLADTDLICKMVADEHRDVRIGAVKALRHFPPIDLVRDTLRNRFEVLNQGGDEEERDEIIRSLSAHAATDRSLREFLHSELSRVLSRPEVDWSARRRTLVVRLLNACGQGGAAMEMRGSQLIYELINDFRAPQSVRSLAIRVFGQTSQPSILTGERILKFLDLPQRGDRVAAYKAAGSFADRCRSNVHVVRQVHGILEKLRTTLIARWKSEWSSSEERIELSSLRDVRSALMTIEEIVASYDEFASRMKASEFDRQANLELKLDRGE